MSENRLLLQQMELGPMGNYIYFIGDQGTKDVVIVDPAWEVDTIINKLEAQGLRPKGLLITHGHPDHINGIDGLLKQYDVPVYVSEHEAYFYRPVSDNIRDVKPADTLMIGEVEIEFLHTPGHTPGSQCFLVEGNLVAGDTLFLDGCGRCDLPGGDAETMFETIDKKLTRLPDSTMIYPGHNYHHKNCDALEHQKKTNPYLRCETLKDFLSLRLG